MKISFIKKASFFLFSCFALLFLFLALSQKSYAECYATQALCQAPVDAGGTGGSCTVHYYDPGYSFACWSSVCGSCGADPGACYTGSGGACNSAQCGGSCGCTGYSWTQPWSKYTTSCVRVYSGLSFSCSRRYVYSTTPACSNANKCMSSNMSGDGYSGSPTETGLRAGTCNCGYGGLYKTCCASTTQNLCNFYYGSSRDSTAPPEGVCPGGTTAVSCGGSGPACGQAACDTLCTPVNGGWSGWSGWSNPAGYSDGGGGTCSTSCGGGTQSRSRACNNPAPNSCGAACSGSGSETQSCNTQACTYNIPTHVYVDYNANGFQDAGEPNYAPESSYSPSNNITYSGNRSGTGSSGAGGSYTVADVTNGQSETITATPPSGWTVTTANPQTVSAPVTVHFGIQPPAPTCIITANPTTVYTEAPGNTSTLTTTATKPQSYTGNLTYTWATGGQVAGTISPPTATSANIPVATTWTAPSGLWDQNQTAQPQATVCQTGTSLCGGCQVGVSNNPPASPPGPPISVVPLYSLSGFVYTDINKTTNYDNPPDSVYSSTPLIVSICPGKYCSGAARLTTTNGAFTTGATPALAAGAYTVSLTNLPDSSYSYSGNSSYVINLGKPCGSEPSSSGATCNSGTGNVTGVSFGITNSNPWIQSTGGDIYMAGGIHYSLIPGNAPLACGGANMSITDAVRLKPGIIYTGNGTTVDFGQGQASGQGQTPNPWNWVVGQFPYNETMRISASTSYATIKNAVDNSGTAPEDLSHVSGCNDLNNCQLPSDLPKGAYIAHGSVKLTGSTYTFPNNDYIFLIDGDLNIDTQVHLTPGATTLFTVSGDIIVGKDVGEASYLSSASNIDGYYSSDKSFIVQGTNTCPTRDLRLNISGAVVTNAAGLGGNFTLNRDMCEQDICPTLSVTARPDFVLNAPGTYQFSNRIWQEIAP